MNNVNYAEVFHRAKTSTVYAHAMVYIREVVADKKRTDSEQVDEINLIIIEAIKHLSRE